MTEDRTADISENDHRPWSITVLSLGIAAASLSGWLRFIQALLQWQVLQSLDLSVSALYLALTGALWGLLGLVSAVGLWQGWPRARTGTLVLTLLFMLWYWVDFLWLKAPEISRRGWPFSLTLSLLGGGLIMLILFLPSTRTHDNDQDASHG